MWMTQNVFHQNFWNCSWLLTWLRALPEQAGDRQSQAWTGTDKSIKRHKSALFLTCFFYCWLLYFILKIGKRRKQRNLMAWFLFFLFSAPSPPPRCENILLCTIPLPKWFHIIHSTHNQFWGSPVLWSVARMVSAILKMWLLQCLIITPIISEHLRAWHLLCSLDPEQEKLGLINWRLKSQNNCALDSRNGFGLGLAGGAIWHYGKYVPK